MINEIDKNVFGLILQWLPLPDLIRSKRVCKNWLTISNSITQPLQKHHVSDHKYVKLAFDTQSQVEQIAHIFPKETQSFFIKCWMGTFNDTTMPRLFRRLPEGSLFRTCNNIIASYVRFQESIDPAVHTACVFFTALKKPNSLNIHRIIKQIKMPNIYLDKYHELDAHGALSSDKLRHDFDRAIHLHVKEPTEEDEDTEIMADAPEQNPLPEEEALLPPHKKARN